MSITILTITMLIEAALGLLLLARRHRRRP